MKKHVLGVLALAAFVGAGCKPEAGTDLLGAGSSSSTVAKSQKQRATAPVVDESELRQLVGGNTGFALALYQVIRESEDNLFYSPYSISVALAMTYAGARGATAEQMADTLHFTLPEKRLHPAFNKLDLELASRAKDEQDKESRGFSVSGQGKNGKGFQLNIANAIWGQVDRSFLPEFLNTLAENYGAGMRLVDFRTAWEKARVTINDWVTKETEGKIRDLLPPGTVNALTRLVLTNAIYFNAAWKHPFEEQVTRDGDFHLLEDGKVTVPMMAQTENFGYAKGEGYEAVELPYEGHELSMVIMAPEKGEFKGFEQSLDTQRLAGILGNLKSVKVALTMPKFEYESTLGLNETLKKLGMADAFDERADFSGMDGTRWLFISDVLHKAFVSVDEEGTEAAAATAVVMALTSARVPKIIELKIDRPFIFVIRDIKTGAVLFVGRVINPSKKLTPH